MVRLDKIDLAIINSLMQDGRKSFRQVAKDINVSTPTVEAHFSRMKGLGIIKNIVPTFDIDKLDEQLSAFIYLKTNPSESVNIANKLSSVPSIKGVYVMTGNYNLIAKVIAEKPKRLEEFIREKLAAIEGIRSISYHIIARTIKEDQSPSLKEGEVVKLRCHYCSNEIAGEPRLLEVGEYQRYFCCNACLTLYKDKYRGRIEAITKRGK